MKIQHTPFDTGSQQTKYARKGIFLVSVAVCLCAYGFLTTQTTSGPQSFPPRHDAIADTLKPQQQISAGSADRDAPDLAEPEQTVRVADATPLAAREDNRNQADTVKTAWTGQDALLKTIALVEEGLSLFSNVKQYTARLTKRERINGILSHEQELELSLRHEPYTVTLRWVRGYKDQTIHYETGQNGGRMLIKLGGWQGRFTPILKLEPDSPIAMRRARYPVTQVGILELARQYLEDRRSDILDNKPMQVTLKSNQWRKDRACSVCVLEYGDATRSPIYRKSICYLDSQMLVPYYIENYTWAEPGSVAQDDDSTLLEQYHYSNWQIQPQFAELDSPF